MTEDIEKVTPKEGERPVRCGQRTGLCRRKVEVWCRRVLGLSPSGRQDV